MHRGFFRIIVFILAGIVAISALIQSLNATDNDVLLDHEGTLVAVFVTRTKVFLLSDGRVTRKRDGASYDNWSKVHKLSNMVGMLTAGAYPPSLRGDIIRNCEDRKVSWVKDVTKVTSLVLQEIWRQVTANPDNQDSIRNTRIFIFIAGFDESLHPHLYFLDNLSEPPFKVQEKDLFVSGHDLEIGAISTGSGDTESPSVLLRKYLTPRLGANSENLRSIIYSAFNNTKDELSKTIPQIGGETFFGEVDPEEGFKDISDELKKSEASTP